MLKKYFTFALILFGLLPCVQAEEIERRSDAWITEFFQKGIMSAFAEYNLKLAPPQNPSPNYYKRMSYSVEYSRYTNTYSLRFVYEYREDWNVLTDNGNHPPAQEQPFQTGSKIQPWTNSNGLGTYSEVYQRSIPNWMIFQSLDSLLIMQGKLGNPLPPLTGLFHSDELKAMKKLQKTNQAAMLSCFDFDQAGNLLEFSKSYLDEFKEENLKLKKPVEDFSIVIRNKADDVVFVKPILHGSDIQIIEGVLLKYGDKRAKIYNFELNAILHKFIPQIFANPQEIIEAYIKDLQAASEKEFMRFETSAIK